MAYNANDDKQVKKAREDADLAEALRLDVIRDVMKSAAGRMWIYSILERCHIYGNAFVPGASDSTFFNLGEANIGKILLTDVQNSSPDLYMQMIKEAKDLK